MHILRFQRTFVMGHRLLCPEAGKCGIPHGHNEKVTVELVSSRDGLDEHNMVVEFSRVKRRWHRFIDEQVDHALQLSHRDPLLQYFRQHEPHQLARVLVTPGDPTTEILCVVFKAKLQTFLQALDLPVQCCAVEVEETPTNSVRFEGQPQVHLPEQGWWWRADDSINDFASELVNC